MAAEHCSPSQYIEHMTPKEHAAVLIGYFERCAKQTPDEETWRLGQATANEWLRLMNTATVSKPEVSALIASVDKNKYSGSGWFDLALGVSHWATSNGFLIPYPLWPHKMTEDLNNDSH
jgi:hypothetical protein